VSVRPIFTLVETSPAAVTFLSLDKNVLFELVAVGHDWRAGRALTLIDGHWDSEVTFSLQTVQEALRVPAGTRPNLVRSHYLAPALNDLEALGCVVQVAETVGQGRGGRITAFKLAVGPCPPWLAALDPRPVDLKPSPGAQVQAFSAADRQSFYRVLGSLLAQGHTPPRAFAQMHNAARKVGRDDIADVIAIVNGRIGDGLYLGDALKGFVPGIDVIWLNGPGTWEDFEMAFDRLIALTPLAEEVRHHGEAMLTTADMAYLFSLVDYADKCGLGAVQALSLLEESFLAFEYGPLASAVKAWRETGSVASFLNARIGFHAEAINTQATGRRVFGRLLEDIFSPPTPPRVDWARIAPDVLVNKLVASLIVDGPEAVMWSGRVTAMLTGVVSALCWRRDRGEIVLSPAVLAAHCDLARLIDLAWGGCLPETMRRQIQAYLTSLPYFPGDDGAQIIVRELSPATIDQHWYAERLAVQALGSIDAN
jgi:hypothetical protein